MRIGELCALKTKNIDLNTGILRIESTLHRVKNFESDKEKNKTKIIIDTPKTETSFREIPLPAFLLNLIKKALHSTARDAFILTGQIDRFIEPRRLTEQYTAILKRLNIEY